MSFVSVAAGVAAGTGLFKIGMGLHQDHLANKVNVPDANYETSPYALQMLGEAQRLKNAKMPGYDEAQQQIDDNAANAFGSATRGASNGAQLLSLLGAITGNSNDATNKLAVSDANYGMNAENNYNNALQTMIGEGDKVYQDQVRKQDVAINEKNALRGAGTQNLGGGLNDLTNIGFLLAQMKNK